MNVLDGTGAMTVLLSRYKGFKCQIIHTWTWRADLIMSLSLRLDMGAFVDGYAFGNA